MLLSNQALRPTENTAVAHCWVMAYWLKTSDLCFAPPIFVFVTVLVDVHKTVDALMLCTYNGLTLVFTIGLVLG